MKDASGTDNAKTYEGPRNQRPRDLRWRCYQSPAPNAPSKQIKARSCILQGNNLFPRVEGGAQANRNLHCGP